MSASSAKCRIPTVGINLNKTREFERNCRCYPSTHAWVCSGIFAKAMHESGPRRGSPVVAVDCSALPENLIEAELFGYAPGAFTGARQTGSTGRIREAQGGTLLLDEIGDMPLAMQGRLLRVLQERQVSPLGGGKAIAVDFTLICATHRNLKLDMQGGRFRADLYYRINGLTLNLPALRQRTDFQSLVRRLLDELAPGRDIAFDSAVASATATCHWPRADSASVAIHSIAE